MSRSRTSRSNPDLNFTGSQLLEMIGSLSEEHRKAVDEIRPEPTTTVTPEMLAELNDRFPGTDLIEEASAFFTRAHETHTLKAELADTVEFIDILGSFDDFRADRSDDIDRIFLMGNIEEYGPEAQEHLEALREAPALNAQMEDNSRFRDNVTAHIDTLRGNIATLRKSPRDRIRNVGGDVSLDDLIPTVESTISVLTEAGSGIPEELSQLQEKLRQQKEVKDSGTKATRRMFHVEIGRAHV